MTTNNEIELLNFFIFNSSYAQTEDEVGHKYPQLPYKTEVLNLGRLVLISTLRIIG